MEWAREGGCAHMEATEGEGGLLKTGKGKEKRDEKWETEQGIHDKKSQGTYGDSINNKLQLRQMMDLLLKYTFFPLAILWNICKIWLHTVVVINIKGEQSELNFNLQ